MVRSLRGSRSVAGPYHYLVDEVDPYDISYLFKRLCLDQVTTCSLEKQSSSLILNHKHRTFFNIMLICVGR